MNGSEIKTVSSYKLEVSEEELIRMWMLSFDHEGGTKFPAFGRLHDEINKLFPSVAKKAEKIFYDKTAASRWETWSNGL